MCWRSSGPPQLKVAQEDITSYKIVRLNANNGTYDAIYYSFHYVPDVLEEGKLEIERIDSRCTEINVAFHSYSEKPIFKFSQFGEKLIKHPKLNIILGCFSLENVLRGNYVVVKCIIPEGTKYYINNCGEIASNRIILTKEYYHVLV